MATKYLDMQVLTFAINSLCGKIDSTFSKKTNAIHLLESENGLLKVTYDDGTTYNLNVATGEITDPEGNATVDWSAILNKPFESLGSTLKVTDGVLDIVKDTTEKVEPGTTDYMALENKPSINGITLDGAITLAELGINIFANEDILNKLSEDSTGALKYGDSVLLTKATVAGLISETNADAKYIAKTSTETAKLDLTLLY